MSRKTLSQDLNHKATQIREYFLILTTGQILATLAGWWPLPSHPHGLPSSGVVGTRTVAS